MAYKNQKKNKQHVTKLRSDIKNWRSIKRRRLRSIKISKSQKQMTLSDMERLIANL